MRSMASRTAGVIGCVACLGSVWAQPLNLEIQRAINAAKIGENARVGVYALDSGTKAALASVRAQDAFIPASNQKILISGAALLVLGPEFVFSTELIRDGDAVVIRGSGDPALADPELLRDMEPRMTVDDVLDALAEAVPKAGLDRVREIVVDDRVFDRELVHPTWPAKQLGDWYCAQVSGINFHTNVLSVFPRPSPEGAGQRPTITVQPSAPWVNVENQALTVREGKNAVSLVRTDERNQFRMRGEVRTPMTQPVQATINDPALFFGQILADRLQRRGVPVGPESGRGAAGPSASVRLATPDEGESSPRVIARVTTPIADVLERCNRDSYNLYAEALIKRIGHQTTGEPGSWKNGASVVRMMLGQKLGPEATASTSIADGSGMSRENSVTPMTVAGWLDVLAREDSAVRDVFTESLALPGEGTLRERFQGAGKPKNELRGKSGYIKGVRTLSGYLIQRETGRRVSYSILINTPSDEYGAQCKKLHEDIVAVLDRWLSKQPAPEPAALGG